MPVSDSHNFVFIHIPKTAGTSIERCFIENNLINTGKKCLQGRIDSNELKTSKYSNAFWHHLNCSEVKKIIGQNNWSNYFKFTIVRNPWDRAVSFYSYMKENTKNPNSLSFGKSYPETFDNWVRQLNLPSDQQSKIVDNNGELMVDFVGRFENLGKDFQLILSKIKASQLKLKHFKKTNRQNYHQYYKSDEIVQIIADKYKKDIDLFEYEF